MRTQGKAAGRARRAGWRRLRSRLLSVVLAVLRVALAPLGWRGAQRLGAALGRVAWRLAPRDRERAREHLAFALPELPAGERERLGRACFAHLGTSLVEVLHMLGADPRRMAARLDVAGWEHVEAVRAGGRPLLLLTAHCGNWEVLNVVFANRGLTVTGVARQQDDPQLDTLMVRLRARYGNRTLARGAPGAARELLRALRGGALLMLIDQDTRVEGDWVPFFGRLAYTPTGAAQIALRQGAAVVPAFCERLADGRHRVTFHPPLALPEDVLEATAVMTRTIEEQVRRCPAQWVWMHRRWRRRPPGEVAEAPVEAGVSSRP